VGILKIQFIADIFLTIMIEMNLNFGFSLRPESDARNNFEKSRICVSIQIFYYGILKMIALDLTQLYEVYNFMCD
jgi:hypothetical protein